MLLDGFALASYRSFGQELQTIGPLNKATLVIGQNNCGKSNVLRFAAEHLPGLINASRTGASSSPSHVIDLKVEQIPAIREVRGQTEGSEEFGGAGLIERLAWHQNPSYNKQHLKRKFDSINTFLRYVTGSESATIEIPAERDTILVHLEGRTLPLPSLGTGIHEVIILAAAAALFSDRLICIEEPEIHLHPTLQRKLLRFLLEKTTNQYLIATHSAHFLEESNATVLHIRTKDCSSIVRLAVDAREKSQVCTDLGYRPSDLLQANCIIWVEGPSDRMYLVHWLRSLAPELKEGIHFSIMFYGGRLLSHLSAEDPEVEEFISLRRLNRNIAILIDSDRLRPRQRLNSTKQRIRQEFDRGPGFAWITQGREIENYIPFEVLEKAVLGVHRNAKKVIRAGQYDRTLKFRSSQGKALRGDKVKVARWVAGEEAALDVLDLRKQMGRIVRFIEETNG